MRMHVFVPRRAAKRTRQLSGTPPTRRPPPPNVPSRAPAPRAQVVPLRYRKFADSPLEGDGFELVVPQHKSRGFPQHSGLIEGFETTDLKIQQKRCLTACGSLKRKKPQPGQIAYAIVSMEWLV